MEWTNLIKTVGFDIGTIIGIIMISWFITTCIENFILKFSQTSKIASLRIEKARKWYYVIPAILGIIVASTLAFKDGKFIWYDYLRLAISYAGVSSYCYKLTIKKIKDKLNGGPT